MTFRRTVTLPRAVNFVQLEQLLSGIARNRKEWKGGFDYDGDHSAEASISGGPDWVSRFWLKSCQPGAVLAIEPAYGGRFPQKDTFDVFVVRTYDRKVTGQVCCCHKEADITPEQACSWLEEALVEAVQTLG